MPQPVRLCNPHLRSHRDYLGGSWVGHSGHLPDGQEATPSELCWAPAGMPPHRAVWTHTAATLPTLQECCEMPQTTALCEVTRSWYGSKAESGVQILRYWDSSSTVPLLQPPVGSTLIGIQPPFKEESMHSLPSPTSPSVAFSTVILPGLFWN